MIFDVHAHLDLISQDYLPQFILNAKKSNVDTIITNSINLNSLKKCLDISEKFNIVKVAAGLYPEENLTKEKFVQFEKFVLKNKEKIIAIGEIGLDKTEKLDFEIQKEIFTNQLNLARTLKIPAIIHSRKAELETLEILENYKDLKIILHCFSGKWKLVQKGNEMGCYFSIPTNIVRSEQFQRMVKDLPKEKILTETDSPYLSPFKDKKNESAFLVESIKKIGDIWNYKIEMVQKQIEKNFLKFFDLN